MSKEDTIGLHLLINSKKTKWFADNMDGIKSVKQKNLKGNIQLLAVELDEGGTEDAVSAPCVEERVSRALRRGKVVLVGKW
jgi:hypothetical protein